MSEEEFKDKLDQLGFKCMGAEFSNKYGFWSEDLYYYLYDDNALLVIDFDTSTSTGYLLQLLYFNRVDDDAAESVADFDSYAELLDYLEV